MILKQFIYAERASLWKQHLSEMEKIFPHLVDAYVDT